MFRVSNPRLAVSLLSQGRWGHGRAISREGARSDLGLEVPPLELEEGEGLAELLGGAGGKLARPEGIGGAPGACWA